MAKFVARTLAKLIAQGWLNVSLGADATFTLQTELDPPLEFQWNFNGIPLAGETNSTLTITNVQRENIGPYTVFLTIGATGLAFRAPAATLAGPLVILQQGRTAHRRYVKSEIDPDNPLL